jgi:hypothetical protein
MVLTVFLLLEVFVANFASSSLEDDATFIYEIIPGVFI